MRQSSGYLFGGTSCFDIVRNTLDHAMTHVKAYSEDAILNRSPDDIVTEIKARYELEFPTLLEEKIWIEDGERTDTIPNRTYNFFDDSHAGSIRTITRHFVTFHVPFEGDGNIFLVEPSSRSVPGPSGTIAAQEILIEIASNNYTAEQMKEIFQANLTSIKQHLGTLRRDLEWVTRQIEEPARQHLERRREELLRSKSLVANLGFPMKRRADAPTTFRAPEVRRKVEATRPAVSKPFVPEPALEETEYQHILSVMDNMTKVMERSPHAFHRMGEEDIRQQFLVQLNAQYEGQATGETFNAQGKTDILIRSEGRNIFIAECKFWRGEKGFLETVDQLLSYLTWRDTKTALVIFNQNKGLSGVLDVIKSSMKTHPQFKRGPQVEGETRFRYVLAMPGDADREIIATILVYDVPKPVE